MSYIEDSRLGNGKFLRTTDINKTVSGISSVTGSTQLPSGTTAERDDPATEGSIRFNSELGKYEGYTADGWVILDSGIRGGGLNQVFVENDQEVTEDYTIPVGRNASSTGPITISADVTVSDGSRWVIL
jgi:hypothetical protein